MKCLISPGTEKRDGYFHTAFYLTGWLAGWLDGWLSGRTMNILDIALFFSLPFLLCCDEFLAQGDNQQGSADGTCLFRKGMWVAWAAARTASSNSSHKFVMK